MQNDLALVISDLFTSLDGDQDRENGVFIVNEEHIGSSGYTFCVDLQAMSFSFKLSDVKMEWLPPCPAAGFDEGDWYPVEVVIAEEHRTNLDPVHMARALYVYLARYVDVKSLPNLSWQALRQMALNKWLNK
jgi:hypothetical protein